MQWARAAQRFPGGVRSTLPGRQMPRAATSQARLGPYVARSAVFHYHQTMSIQVGSYFHKTHTSTPEYPCSLHVAPQQQQIRRLSSAGSPNAIEITKKKKNNNNTDSISASEVERRKRARVFTVSNMLSFMRIASAPVIGYFLVVRNDHLTSAVIIVVSSLTDFVDGYIARAWDQITDLGTMLDPLADKLLVATLAVALSVSGLLQPLVAFSFLARDVLLTVATAVFRYITLRRFLDSTSVEKGLPRTKMDTKTFFNLKMVGQEVRPPFISKLNTFLQLATLVILVALPVVVNSGYIGADDNEEKQVEEDKFSLFGSSPLLMKSTMGKEIEEKVRRSSTTETMAVSKFIAIGLFSTVRDFLTGNLPSSKSTKSETAEAAYDEYWMLNNKNIHHKYVIELVDYVPTSNNSSNQVLYETTPTTIQRMFCVETIDTSGDGPSRFDWSQMLWGEPNNALVRQVKKVLVDQDDPDGSRSEHLEDLLSRGLVRKRTRIALISVDEAFGVHPGRIFTETQSSRILGLEMAVCGMVMASFATTLLSAGKYAIEGRKLLRVRT